MLAVQRPSMGSSKPPGQNKPFGYSYDTTNSVYPFPSPPVPAPGPSLLDDNESKFLDSFFDGVSTDHFNADFFPAPGDGMDDMGFNWHDLPPTFMGTASSFGQQPLPSSNNIPNIGFPDMNANMVVAHDQIASTPSADVLAAATLLQNGHNRSHSMGNEALFAPQDMSLQMAPRPNSQTTQLMQSYSQASLRGTQLSKDNYIRDTYYAELMFGPAAGDGRPHPKGPPKDADIHWGTDTGFGSGQGFIAPPGQVSIETIEQKLMHVVECAEAKSGDGVDSVPSSPLIPRLPEPPRRYSEKALNGFEHGKLDGDSRSRKRRKSKMKEEDDEDDEDGAAAKGSRKRRPKSMTSVAAPSSSSQSPPPAKRRKSAVASATKPSRENLTEDQKRENHIKSEQKRRTLIKEGFDDLNELVPDLKGGGHSKSVVLVMAADWLEDLIKGNKILQARLRELEASKESKSL